jgi:hypothetical protein
MKEGRRVRFSGHPENVARRLFLVLMVFMLRV